MSNYFNATVSGRGREYLILSLNRAFRTLIEVIVACIPFIKTFHRQIFLLAFFVFLASLLISIVFGIPEFLNGGTISFSGDRCLIHLSIGQDEIEKTGRVGLCYSKTYEE